MKTQDPIEQRGLPAAPELEKLILASILKGCADYAEVRSCLENDDFAVERHREIYGMCGALIERGIEPDRVTIAQALHETNRLDAIGGVGYLVDLDDNCPALPRLDDYIRVVRDKAILRKIVAIADNIRSEAILETRDPRELLANAEKFMADLGMNSQRESEFKTPGEVIRTAGGLNQYLNRRKEAGVLTGFSRLDERTGGIRPGQLWTIAAVTGGGKSTFARNIALNAARETYPGAFITLEQTESEVTDGFICAQGQIETQIIRGGLAGHYMEQVRAACSAVSDLPIHVRDQAGATIPKLHAELRKLKAEFDIKYAIVDYLQLMMPVGKFGTRAEQVGHLSRGLKLIGLDLKIGMVALSQIKRLEAKRPPELHDLRESGSIENDSDLVLFLHCPWQEEKLDAYPTDLIIAKQRGGPTDTIPFMFRKSTGTFFEA